MSSTGKFIIFKPEKMSEAILLLDFTKLHFILIYTKFRYGSFSRYITANLTNVYMFTDNIY